MLWPSKLPWKHPMDCYNHGSCCAICSEDHPMWTGVRAITSCLPRLPSLSTRWAMFSSWLFLHCWCFSSNSTADVLRTKTSLSYGRCWWLWAYPRPTSMPRYPLPDRCWMSWPFCGSSRLASACGSPRDFFLSLSKATDGLSRWPCWLLP